MKKSNKLAACVFAGLLIFSGSAAAQTPAAHSWTTEQIVTSSVREAWALGGKTEEGFFDIVQALTELVRPEARNDFAGYDRSGYKAGNWIKKEAKKDPDQLLYVIVDRAVQHTGTHQSPSAN